MKADVKANLSLPDKNEQVLSDMSDPAIFLAHWPPFLSAVRVFICSDVTLCASST